MAEVASTRMLSLGSRAPEFELRDARGEGFALDDVRGAHGLVVVFACNHCPYVVLLAEALGKFAEEMEGQGIGMVAINSNDAARYPADAPDKMGEFAGRHGWNFPYLVDEDQSVARAYVAACTPDFYLFDGELKLVYCGQFDGARPKNGQAVTGEDLRAAVKAMVSGKGPLQPQTPSTGCSIKWKPGSEPG